MTRGETCCGASCPPGGLIGALGMNSTQTSSLDSRVADVGGPVHFIDFGGSGPPMVLVHGLGGSAVNWLAVGPALAQRARVVALDLPGFGRTPPAGRSTRL